MGRQENADSKVLREKNKEVLVTTSVADTAI